MFGLPLELQIMTIENLQDHDSLVALYDSLPSSDAFLKRLLLYRIFDTLRQRNAKHIETLRQCREAVYEMRDILGMEILLPKFQALVDQIDVEMRINERPVEFRGLTHPEQSGTRLKKGTMQKHLRGKKRHSEQCDEESSLRDTPVAPWMTFDGTSSLQQFKDSLYRHQMLM